FQAEDGIRDFHVTGVQTCALPISKDKLILDAGCGSGYILSMLALDGYEIEGIDNNQMMLDLAKDRLESLNLNVNLINHDLRKPRSEERRVGKECRSRG